MMQLRTKKLIDQLNGLAASGHSMAEAAEKLDVSYQTVAIHARAHSIDFRRAYASGKTERNAEIARLYIAGSAQADLARDFGISRERVRQICERAGCVSERKRHEDFVSIVAGTCIRKNLTLDELSAMFGINRATAWRYCHERGVVPPKMTAEETAELEVLSKAVREAGSIRKAASGDHAKAEKLRRYMLKNGIKDRGRSRHEDFSQRKILIEKWRGEGRSWPECAELLAKKDGRKITTGGIYVWAWKHLPHLFDSKNGKISTCITEGGREAA